MQKQLQLLRDLQELDAAKSSIENERQTSIDEQEDLKAKVGRLQEMVDHLTEEIGAIDAEKAELLKAIALEQENVERSEGRLPQIKTQKEYVAVLKEVDTAKKLAKELQTQIDAKDEALASLGSDKAEKDEELGQTTEQCNARCAEIDESLTGINGKLDEMVGQRNSFLDELPTKLRKRYELLMSRRGGVAVVEARNGACLGCHMHLPPQLYNSLFVVTDIQTCPHCHRLLFVSGQV